MCVCVWESFKYLNAVKKYIEVSQDLCFSD